MNDKCKKCSKKATCRVLGNDDGILRIFGRFCEVCAMQERHDLKTSDPDKYGTVRIERFSV